MFILIFFMFIFILIQGKAPASINLPTNYNLRGVNALSLPKVNSTKYGLKCFSFSPRNSGIHYLTICTLAGTKDFVSKIRSLTF